jgi:hypothetical protein
MHDGRVTQMEQMDRPQYMHRWRKVQKKNSKPKLARRRAARASRKKNRSK